MSNYGIICETNPMHNGHKYLIDRARALGAERIVCIMSGNTVQRGEFAIADKYVRAEALIKCGADLVIELPFPWCSGSAEFFSACGVAIADKFCDTIIFGSECGDIEILRKAAEAASSKSFKEEYLNGLANGTQATALYHEMLYRATGYDLSSNDLLGIEYIKAGKKLGSNIKFVTVTRNGDSYLAYKATDSTMISARAIRNLWRENKFHETSKYIPGEAFEVYHNSYKNGDIYSEAALDMFWISFFRLHDGKDFAGIAGAEGGLANRFCTMAKKATTTEQLISLVKNKRYTDSNIQRTMLYCLAGVTKEDLASFPTETLLLASNAKGRELIAYNRKANGFSLVTKPADANITARQNILSQKIDSVYSMAFDRKHEADHYLKGKPYIE